MKHFLSLESLCTSELEALIEHGVELKANRGDLSFRPLMGQTWAMIFTKSSTRTRVSFEVGIHELGAHAMFLSGRDLQLGRGEPIKDTARVLGRMVDGAIIRTFDQDDIEGFAAHSNIPTINALSDAEHPCQVVADLQTMRERLPDWRGARVCFLGDGACNMAISWLWAAKLLDLELVIGAPEGFHPEPELIARLDSSKIRVETDPIKAVEGCDVLYTDVWVSMGKEDESEDRIKILQPYQVNERLIAAAKPGVIVMHCLPAYRDKEITEDVLEAHADVIFEQAENRLHAQKAILCRSVA
tara:strand:- start:2677 stop:3576 length:900 start_codon:yes stop_codon:yes gene_type:complete